MSALGQSTRSRIVEAARSLFWYDGYNVTTVDKILARAKANPGSFYRFFNTKESVLLTVLSNSARNFVPGLVTPVMQNVADPIERVFEILNFYRGNLTKAKFAACSASSPLKFPKSSRTSISASPSASLSGPPPSPSVSKTPANAFLQKPI
jgi:AcrR family transcriptional regulator